MDRVKEIGSASDAAYVLLRRVSNPRRHQGGSMTPRDFTPQCLRRSAHVSLIARVPRSTESWTLYSLGLDHYCSLDSHAVRQSRIDPDLARRDTPLVVFSHFLTRAAMSEISCAVCKTVFAVVLKWICVQYDTQFNTYQYYDTDQQQHQKAQPYREPTFSNIFFPRPWTKTYDLDLRIWPLNFTLTRWSSVPSWRSFSISQCSTVVFSPL